MSRRGRLAIAIAVGAGELGHRLPERLGWWIYQAGKRAAHLLLLPERLAWWRRQRREGGRS